MMTTKERILNELSKIEFPESKYKNRLHISKIYKEVAKKLDVSPGYVKATRLRHGHTLSTEPVESKIDQQVKVAKERKAGKKKYYFMTWAQNATPVHDMFWENLLAYKDHLDAELLVVAGRYRNPTSVFNDAAHEECDLKVEPYLDLNRHVIHDGLCVMSDIKIQPTASKPLTGVESMTGRRSAIVGHPRQHLAVVPTLPSSSDKVILSSGACTLPNYTDSKSGKKGEFHHVVGFTIIEIDGDIFHIRQVSSCDDGSFTDLIYNVSGGKVSRIDNVPAVKLGDVHCGQDNPEVMTATKQMLDLLKPGATIVPDIFDGYSVAKHDRGKNPIEMFNRMKNGMNDIQDELDNMFKWINDHLEYNLVIESANHNDHLDQYLCSTHWTDDLVNAEKYVELLSVKLAGQAPLGLVAYEINQMFGNDVHCLGRDDSFKVEGWELGQHGDKGANGSRGSVNQFKKLPTKIVIAHSHSPAREDGCIRTGIYCKRNMSYVSGGMSSWLEGHAVIHHDGKAQIILITKGRFTTLS